MQIAKRILRLERAERAAENPGRRMKGPINLDTRYEVPTSRNNHTNIYNFLRERKGDPAIAVSFPFEH
jgi:hypothetical protein